LDEIDAAMEDFLDEIDIEVEEPTPIENSRQ